MPRAAFLVPITASRYKSLASRLSEEDMFSSDLTNAELQSVFASVPCPCLFVFSKEDEYVPKTINIDNLSKRILNALAAPVRDRSQVRFFLFSLHSSARKSTCGEQAVIIPDADHALTSPKNAAVFIEKAVKFISS